MKYKSNPDNVSLSEYKVDGNLGDYSFCRISRIDGSFNVGRVNVVGNNLYCLYKNGVQISNHVFQFDGEEKAQKCARLFGVQRFVWVYALLSEEVQRKNYVNCIYDTGTDSIVYVDNVFDFSEKNIKENLLLVEDGPIVYLPSMEIIFKNEERHYLTIVLEGPHVLLLKIDNGDCNKAIQINKTTGEIVDLEL